MGLSYLFKSNFNMDYTLALGLMGFFTALYVVLGGYKSIAMIDVLFGKIMIVGVCILLCFTIDKGNGLANITANLSAIDPDLTQLVGPPGIWPLFCLVF
jgi:SSS family solute:Na+ symporter